jgi:peptide/nickel transport system permease protein
MLVALVAAAPQLFTSQDPGLVRPLLRLKPMSLEHWLGTDALGRDLWSRLVYGARVSLLVGLLVAAFSVVFGTALGLVAGYFPLVDTILIRFTDALMAIPAILLAIALAAVNAATFPPLVVVIFALSIPEIPRVIRLVRSVTLSMRTELFVEAAIMAGTSPLRILWRHILPGVRSALFVQASYIAAFAMLGEAVLSFLGAGVPPEIPSWGNMIADGRSVFELAPLTIIAPGCALALVILGINILGDELRDKIEGSIWRRV